MKISQTTNYEIIARLNRHVHELHTKLYPKYFKEYNFEAIKEFFKGIISHPQHLFLLLEDDEQYLGYAWIELKNYPENAFKKAYQSVYVHQISISESHRKKGYGSKLMEEIDHIAKINHIDMIELDYWCDNDIAKSFYKKQGFTKYREFVYKEI
jgi:ribosomal protein S18 acetylase RimI-like enzyme